MNKHLKAFLKPKLTKSYIIRVVVVLIVAFLLFRFVLPPFWVKGRSMEPTYSNGSFIFGLRPRYLFSEPDFGDVVFVELGGQRVMYLKRVVALSGETVEFRDGTLYIDGRPKEEPWVKKPCDWNMPSRTVKPGHLYVVGDNRSMDIGSHSFGQVRKKKIAGGPLW